MDVADMMAPVCPPTAVCKCCASPATLYGVVDFHKNCEDRRQTVLGASGIPVYYYRCLQCRFIFTTAFDAFTHEDFAHYIYNDEYILVDPDYLEARPKGNADFLSNLFSQAKPLSMLDYGGGSGVLAALLRDAGFPDVDTYDPFVADYAVRPQRRYDCIVCFEVAEHSPDPASTFADLNDLLSEDGIVVFSTLLQPADIDQQGLNWWYAGPRNGHVSLYSRESLNALLQPYGFKSGSFNNNMHVLYRAIPDFATHFIPSA